MKIAFYYFGDNTFRYGIEKMLAGLMNQLSNDHEVTLIFSGTLSEHPRFISNKIKIIELHKKRLMGSLSVLQTALQEINPHVVVSSTEYPNFLIVIARLVSRKKYILVLLTHNPLTPRLRSMWNSLQSFFVRAGIHVLYPLADELIAVSKSTATDLIKYLPRQTDVRVIYNPIVENIGLNDSFNYSQEKNRKSLLYVGRLVENKRVYLIIEALAILDSSYTLEIVGSGSEESRLRILAKEKGLSSRVRFHGYQENLDIFYHNAGVLILPSSWEGFGNVIIEAMAWGCQIVVPKGGSAQLEAVDNGLLGFTFEPDNPESLPATITNAINNPMSYYSLTKHANQFSMLKASVAYLRSFSQHHNPIYPRTTFKQKVKDIIKCYLWGYDHQCSVCGQHLKKFDSLPGYYHLKFQMHLFKFGLDEFETFNWRQYQCPSCKSSDRERLYAFYIIDRAREKTKNEQWLDFAPSPAFSRLIKENFKTVTYISADLCRESVDMHCDIQDMKNIDTASFDFVVCSHILEHVPDDIQALRELFRILRTGGQAIIMAPVIKTLTQDHELQIDLTEAERWHEYGQGDHLRLYSSSGFSSKIESVGFSLERIRASEFGIKKCERYGIDQSSVLYLATKPS